MNTTERLYQHFTGIVSPDMTDLEHETLRALVIAYGGGSVAKLALAMQLDINDEEKEDGT